MGSDGNYHLYRLAQGEFKSFDFPEAVQTAPAAYSHVGGLNVFGDIVSAYASDTPFANLSNVNVEGLMGFCGPLEERPTSLLKLTATLKSRN